MCGEMEYQRTLDRKKMPLCVLGHFFMGSEVHTRAQQTLAIPGSIGPFHSSPQEQEQGPKVNCLYHKNVTSAIYPIFLLYS